MHEPKASTETAGVPLRYRAEGGKIEDAAVSPDSGASRVGNAVRRGRGQWAVRVPAVEQHPIITLLRLLSTRLQLHPAASKPTVNRSME